MSFELIAVVDSQTYWFNPQGIDPASVSAHFDEESVSYQSSEWIRKLGAVQGYDDVVVLDVTASKELAGKYLEIAEQGMHLISAN